MGAESHRHYDGRVRDFTTINLFGAFWSSRFVLPDILASGKGTILLASATGALRGMPGLASFSPWKFGLRSLCQIITREYQSKGTYAVNIVVDGRVSLSAEGDAESRLRNTRDLEGCTCLKRLDCLVCTGLACVALCNLTMQCHTLLRAFLQVVDHSTDQQSRCSAHSH